MGPRGRPIILIILIFVAISMSFAASPQYTISQQYQNGTNNLVINVTWTDDIQLQNYTFNGQSIEHDIPPTHTSGTNNKDGDDETCEEGPTYSNYTIIKCIFHATYD